MSAPRRLFLHVGLQKTGTSYLQGVMQQNKDELAAQGLDLVPHSRRQAFELMLLVRGRYNPERDTPSTRTALDRFARQLEKAPGDRALLSQESLAAARPAQIRRLMAACGDREVHVVLTVRDLGRQLPSSWQQELKAAHTDDYEGFLHRLRDSEQAGLARHPWIQLDAPTVLARWSQAVPADRIHVVTVPPSGSSPTLLLERFCTVLDVDAPRLVPEQSPSNTSLGRVQAEVLRRVNADLPDELRRRQVYGDIGKRFLASQVLAGQHTRRIRVPQEFREWCLGVSEAHVAALAEAGYAVVGDLDDLRCLESAFSDEEVDPTEGEVAAAAVAALVQVMTLRGTVVRRRRAARLVAGHGGWTGRLRRWVRRARSEP